MRRFLGLLLIGLLLCSGTAQAADPVSGLAKLPAWANKYPFDKIDGKDLWETTDLLPRIGKLIGEERLNQMKNYIPLSPNQPVLVRDGVYNIAFCRQHQCNEESVVIFVRPSDGDLHVCWHTSGDVGDMWFSTGSPSQDVGYGGCLEEIGFALFDLRMKK